MAAKKKATKLKVPKKKFDVVAESQKLAAEVAALPPNQPVAVLVATTSRLGKLAKSELSRLSKLPDFDRSIVEKIPVATVALSSAESTWIIERSKSRAGISPKRIKEATSLKTDIMDSGRYLLRNDPEAQQELDETAEGSGVADTAADLGQLARFLRTHKAVFALDQDLPADAAERADAFAKELAAGIDPTSAADAQAARNRLFWIVNGYENDVRAALRFIWRKQPTKLTMLGLSYGSQLNKAKRRSGKSGGGPKPA